MRKLVLSLAGLVALTATPTYAQILTSSIVQGLSTSSTISVSVSGMADYAIFNSVDSNDTYSTPIEGSADSFSVATLTDSSTPVGASNEGVSNNDMLLRTNTGAFTFSGYSGASTTNTGAWTYQYNGSGPEFGFENGKVTFTETVIAPNETLTLYTNAKYLNETFTATLSGDPSNNPTTSVSVTDGTASGAVNDGNLAAESTFVLSGATVGDTLTFTTTYSIPASGRNYPQAYLDAITVAVPEPSALGYLGFGAIVLAGVFRLRKLTA